MTDTFSMSAPSSTADWFELVRQWWTPIVGVIGAVWGLVALRRKLSAKEREEQRLQGKAIRYLLDAQRQALHALVVYTGAEGNVPAEPFDLAQLVRHRELVGQVSDELWVHDGHASEREMRRKGDIEKWLTRTQAIQERSTTKRLRPSQPQDMFRDDDIKRWRRE